MLSASQRPASASTPIASSPLRLRPAFSPELTSWTSTVGASARNSRLSIAKGGAARARKSALCRATTPLTPLTPSSVATLLLGLAPAVRKRAGREQVEDAVADLRAAVVRAFGPRGPAARGKGGKARILFYLKAHVGEWVYGDELAAVSGIGEWARRVRELRVEEGYDIEEESGLYRLNRAEPDEACPRSRFSPQS